MGKGLQYGFVSLGKAILGMGVSLPYPYFRWITPPELLQTFTCFTSIIPLGCSVVNVPHKRSVHSLTKSRTFSGFTQICTSFGFPFFWNNSAFSNKAMFFPAWIYFATFAACPTFGWKLWLPRIQTDPNGTSRLVKKIWQNPSFTWFFLTGHPQVKSGLSPS